MIVMRRGFGDSPDTPDTLDLSSLQGWAYVPPPNTGIDLSSSTITQETAGGIPLNVQLAGTLGVTGSGANQIMLIGAGLVFVLLMVLSMKGGRHW